MPMSWLCAALSTGGPVRQDRIKAAADKLDNWPAFSLALVLRGLDTRAFGYPVQPPFPSAAASPMGRR